MIKLHLGCGPVIKEGFINYDLKPGAGGIKHDLTKPLPHDSQSIDFVFSEHFFEHINRYQGLELLKECYRVLKVGGKIRITTPDLKVLLQDYFDKKIDRWSGGFDPKTPCQMVNYGMTWWGHQFTYDLEELFLIFKESGFINPYKAPHGEFEARGYTSELTVEAIK